MFYKIVESSTHVKPCDCKEKELLKQLYKIIRIFDGNPNQVLDKLKGKLPFDIEGYDELYVGDNHISFDNPRTGNTYTVQFDWDGNVQIVEMETRILDEYCLEMTPDFEDHDNPFWTLKFKIEPTHTFILKKGGKSWVEITSKLKDLKHMAVINNKRVRTKTEDKNIIHPNQADLI